MLRNIRIIGKHVAIVNEINRVRYALVGNELVRVRIIFLKRVRAWQS
jgi:hypothetical protein